MTFVDTIRTTIDNLFVPRDGLYRQAKELVAQHDPTGSGRVDVRAIQSGEVAPPPGLFGITTRGFARADSDGNGNGYASIREVRNLLKQYDTGNGWNPGSAGDRTIDGVELLRLLGDLANPTPVQHSGPEQVTQAVTELG